MEGASDVITIFHVESDGRDWATFLMKKMSESQYNIPTHLREMTSMSDCHTYTGVNVALFSPDAMEPDILTVLNDCNSTFSLAVLLGVEEQEFRNFVKKNDLINLMDWVIYEPETTEESVKVLLMSIINLYEIVHGGESEEEHPDHPLFHLMPIPHGTDSSSEDSNYSRLPPPRQVNALFQAVPVTIKGKQSLLVLLDRKAEEPVSIEFTSGIDIPAKYIDKAAYIIPLDGMDDDKTSFQINCGDQTLSGTTVTTEPIIEEDIYQVPPKRENTKLDAMRQLLLDVTDPICLLCQALNIPSSRQGLDMRLAIKFQDLHSVFDLANVLKTDRHKENKSDEMWPTLMHLCAEYNLPLSIQALLKVPDMGDTCHIANRFTHTPLDIARNKHHTEITDILERYLKKQKSKGNVPGNKDSGFPQEESDIEEETFGTEEENVSPPTPHRVKEPRYVNDTPRSSQWSSESTRSEGYDGGDETDTPISYGGFASKEGTLNSFQKLQRSVSDKLLPEPKSIWYDTEMDTLRKPISYVRRKSESDTQYVPGDKERHSRSLKKKLSDYFKLPRRKGSLPANSIPEEKLSQYANRGFPEGGFPCSPIQDSLPDTEIDHNKTTLRREPKKSKNPLRKKAGRRKSVRMIRALKDDNITVLEMPTKHNFV